MSKTHVLTLAVALSFALVSINPSAATVRDTHNTTYYTNFNHTHVTKKGVKYAARSSTKRHTAIASSNSSKERVKAMVIEEALAQGVPVKFAVAVAKTESNFTCTAHSYAGALGVMQIKLSTARGIGYRGTAAGLYDCRTGIKWGIAYLKQAISVADGNLCHAAHLYFSGLFARRMTKGGRNYCGQVMKNQKLASND